MINDNHYPLDIYKIDTKAKLDKRKVFIILLIVLSFICILLIGKYIVRIVSEHKVYKQYEAQLQAIRHQEQEKQAQVVEEEERKRQEKIPKLTEVRKTEYGKHLSI